MAIITLNNNSLSSVTALPAGVGGKVLQVVQSNSSTNFSTSSGTMVSTGFSASITPTSTSNKVSVFISFSPYHNGTGRQSFYTIDRNGTLLTPSGDTNFVKLYDNASQIITSQSFNYLDSPSSTSALTYTLFASITGGELRLNTQSDSTNIILMEIAG